MSIYKKQTYTDCEILAPAGSYQCMTAAFNAGADAVYVGGSMFGARAYADNFDTEELIRAIDYAHLRGRRLYLTVNTLLKQEELESALVSYIEPLYLAGLDAVIVQDMGVLSTIRAHFPLLDIHASTQMTVTGVNFAKELKALGVTRIVTARELSYKEINAIYEATQLEIESFVHGALCYCYSGQCLLSSMIGGRSGNRGRCAQPCRLNYELYDSKGRINSSDEKYLLSPKDMCTLNILPDILKSGVYSLKIEGRMKKPEYVAGVTAVYRKYVDMIKSGASYNVAQQDIEALKDIYNRGGFTDGFYKRQNGRDMMSLYKPNHYGSKVADIVSTSKNSVKIKAVQDISADDVLEINLRGGVSVGVRQPGALKKGAAAEIKLAGNADMNKNLRLHDQAVYRTRNNRLISDIETKIINNEFKVAISGKAVIRKQQPMSLLVWADISDGSHYYGVINAYAEGMIPDTASSRPAEKEDIIRRLQKTGGTDFSFKELSVELDDNLFIPVSALNELRRECLEKLKADMLARYKRQADDAESDASDVSGMQDDSGTATVAGQTDTYIECIVSDGEQLEEALSCDYISHIGLELSRFSYEDTERHIRMIKDSGREAYIALPYICRERALNDFESHKIFFGQMFSDGLVSGIIIRNYEEYIYFAKSYEQKLKFVFDSNVYMFNRETKQYMRELGKRYGRDDTVYTVPYELNRHEICELEPQGCRMEIYGYIPVMVSAGCLKKTSENCDGHTDSSLKLKDRMNNTMSVVTNCRYCYNVIFNSVPLYLADDADDIKAMGINQLSIRLTTEDRAQTRNILARIRSSLNGEALASAKIDYTRGHFRRGVM